MRPLLGNVMEGLGAEQANDNDLHTPQAATPNNTLLHMTAPPALPIPVEDGKRDASHI